MDYKLLWEELYSPLRREGVFTWDRMYGKEYALAAVYPISQQDRQEIAEASEQLGKIFAKTVAAVQLGSDQLLTELGLPSGVARAVRASILPSLPTCIGRFDFVSTTEGWKVLEFNSDTPGGIVEAFYVNGRVCDYFGVADPNAGLMRDIAAVFQQALEVYKKAGYKTDRVVFSALDWHEEDAGTTRFLLEQSGVDAKFVPLKDLRFYRNGLYAIIDGELQPVDVLYRLHPLGLLAEEQDTDGFPTGAAVLELIAQGKLAVINPPSALIAQTKGLQALIWNLREAGEFFDSHELGIIGRYMLPTYFDNCFLGKCPYVTKPVLGREGNNVAIYDTAGTRLASACENQYSDQMVVFQQFVELEAISVETENGLYCGYPIWGSFLLAGKASAINARIGGLITDELSYYLPTFISE